MEGHWIELKLWRERMTEWMVDYLLCLGMLELMILFFYAVDWTMSLEKISNCIVERVAASSQLLTSSRDISCFCFVLSARCFMLSPFVESRSMLRVWWRRLLESIFIVSHTRVALFIQLFLFVEIFPAVSTQTTLSSKTSDGHLKNHT